MYRISLANFIRRGACAALLVAGLGAFAGAQEKPYFVTYSHDLEEPGNLEIETKTTLGRPDGANRFGALATEFEYGARAWWTTEVYLDGQTTANESTIPTGFRWENRFRPLMKEHWINPVLYVEFENINGADKTLLEVVGHDGQEDLAEHNGVAREEVEHEGELKLILSSNFRDWNISENFIAEKNFAHEPWEFGYAVGASRPLKTALSLRQCTFCLEKLRAGVEAYGGLGDTWDLSLSNTSHYIAPLVGWDMPARMRLSFSPGFGLTGTSMDRVYRVGFAYEMPQIGSLFRGRGKGTVR
ncbi:hypothetical protein [Occallatibacter riparius]|uniref:Uncharacterized protein n=1 Tax=Occallatibacter riparius TaxID=1002689 RepID=A0A9J7BVS2_9BACT|nr:hypothetical protein [Occallatibacter riparius]UWZ86736.1 hypothetical protein MOP44_12490 [Occallatibacter riparius]